MNRTAEFGEINNSLQLTVGYKSTIDDGPGDLEMSVFSISLVAGWHRLVEGMKRLGRSITPSDLLSEL
jgi:hypothetical protein